MVRRLNIDGDGQGDLSRATAARCGRCWSTRSSPTGTGSSTSAATTFSYGEFGGEPHRRRPARRRGLHRRPVPHRRGRVRGHPAPGHLLPGRPAPRPARTPVAAGQPPPPRLLHAGHHRGAYPGGRPDRQDQVRTRRAVAWPTPTRCSTCRDQDQAKLRLALQIPALSPGWQESFRRTAAAGRGHRTTAAPPAPAGPAGPAWPGFRKLRVTKIVPESRDRVIDLPRRTPTAPPLPAAKPGQYLTLRVDGAGRAAPGAQLLAVLGPRRPALPDQRQARAARRRQQLSHHPPDAPDQISRPPPRAAISSSTRPMTVRFCWCPRASA